MANGCWISTVCSSGLTGANVSLHSLKSIVPVEIGFFLLLDRVRLSLLMTNSTDPMIVGPVLDLFLLLSSDPVGLSVEDIFLHFLALLLVL